MAEHPVARGQLLKIRTCRGRAAFCLIALARLVLLDAPSLVLGADAGAEVGHPVVAACLVVGERGFDREALDFHGVVSAGEQVTELRGDDAALPARQPRLACPRGRRLLVVFV